MLRNRLDPFLRKISLQGAQIKTQWKFLDRNTSAPPTVTVANSRIFKLFGWSGGRFLWRQKLLIRTKKGSKTEHSLSTEWPPKWTWPWNWGNLEFQNHLAQAIQSLAILSKLRHRKAANPVLQEVMMMVWMRSASPPVASQVKSSPFFTFSIGMVPATTSGFQTLLGLFD